MDYVPKCFTSHQYKVWKEAARMASPGIHGFCADCTPEYKKEMIQAHKCSFPNTRFVTDEDGMVSGRRSEDDLKSNGIPLPLWGRKKYIASEEAKADA